MKGYNLQRFVDAQHTDYQMALSEIMKGRKRSHWIWYVFPQFYGGKRGGKKLKLLETSS